MQFRPSGSQEFARQLSPIAPWISPDPVPTLLSEASIDQFPSWLTALVTATQTGKGGLFIFTPDQNTIPAELRSKLSALSAQKLLKQFQNYWKIALTHTRFCSLLGSTVNYHPSSCSIYRTYSSNGELEGESIGLAVTLAFIQYLSHMPLTQSLITSATIDENGDLGPVLKLKEKLSQLQNYPHINHVGVCFSQGDEAKRIIKNLGLDRKVKVSAWSNLASVLDELITKEKELIWDRHIGASILQETRLNHLLFCIIYNRIGEINKDALLKLLGTVQEKLNDRNTLKSSVHNVISIIQRHRNLSISSDLINDKFQQLTQNFTYTQSSIWFGLPLEDLPAQFNIDQYLTSWAHLIQDVCDCTEDNPELSSQVITRAHEILDIYHGGEGRARLMGALARYYFSYGNLKKALSLSMSSIYIWCSLPMYTLHDEVTYPLSFLYRIAAAIPKEHELYAPCKEQLHPLTIQCFQLSAGQARSWKYVFESWCKYQLRFPQDRSKLLALCYCIITKEIKKIDQLEYNCPLPNQLIKSIAGMEDQNYIAYLMLNYIAEDDGRCKTISQKLKNSDLLRGLLNDTVPSEAVAKQSDLLCWRGYHKMKLEGSALNVVEWFKLFHQYT